MSFTCPTGRIAVKKTTTLSHPQQAPCMRCAAVSKSPSLSAAATSSFTGSRLRSCRSRLARQPAAMAAVRARLDPDNASILVAGGGGVALDVTRRLKDMGAWVWMLQRSDDRRSQIEGMMAIVVRGDALVVSDVEAAFAEIEEVDAVVSTIGGSPADARADSEGNINLIRAAAAKGVKRFVLVTSIGTGDSAGAPPKPVYDVLEKVLVQKGKAEEFLRSIGGDMEFVIIRPGGLKSEPATGNGVLTEDKTVCGAIHRDDVADLVCRALLSDKAANKVLSAVDQSQLMGDPQFEVFQL